MSQKPADQSPTGWELVPREPEQSMLRAAVCHFNGPEIYTTCKHGVLGVVEQEYREAWLAMIDAAPEAPADRRVRRPRADAQIVAQTEELAAALDGWRWGGKLTDGTTYRDSASPKAQSCWAMACVIQGLLTDTDPENAAAEVDGAQGKQGGAE